MFVPINTDAPLYYRPWGTIGLIALNCLVFALTGNSLEISTAWSLPYGQGFTPVQWVTSNFLHASLGHLIGNMIFLWGFGLVVEGKLGWHRFLPIYLAIGVLQCAVEQAIFWNQEGSSLGASAVIFGLMAMSLIWAPMNNLTLFLWIFIFLRPLIFEWKIVTFAGFKLAMSALYIVLAGSPSEILHLMGGAVGAVIGIVMLRRNWVDCEGWDLFTRMAGRQTGMDQASAAFTADFRRRSSARAAKRKPKSDPALDAAPPEPRPPQLRFSELIAEHKPHAALRELQRARHLRPDWQPPPREMLALARGLRKAKVWDECLEAYRSVLTVRPDVDAARLEAAEILVLVKERPTAARRVLQPCRLEQLTPPQQQRLQQLTTRINSLIDSGVLEVECSQWNGS